MGSRSKRSSRTAQNLGQNQEEVMTEQQQDGGQQVDAGDVESAQVDTGAQEPQDGGNARQVEQQPPAPLEGDEKPADTGEAQDENVRTDASGRVLNPWESAPKAKADTDSE